MDVSITFDPDYDTGGCAVYIKTKIVVPRNCYSINKNYNSDAVKSIFSEELFQRAVTLRDRVKGGFMGGRLERGALDGRGRQRQRPPLRCLRAVEQTVCCTVQLELHQSVSCHSASLHARDKSYVLSSVALNGRASSRVSNSRDDAYVPTLRDLLTRTCLRSPVSR